MDHFNFFKSKLSNSKILVTGGAGFIGSNLCEYLLKLDINVICLDNLSTGYESNISKFLSNKKFSFVQGDIRNYNACLQATKGCDFVLHQAALGSVPRSIKDPITSNQVNVDGFLNMLEACRLNKVSRFIFAASSSTYGDSEKLPKIENNIGKPLSPYAVTKYVNELYADVYNKIYNLNYIGLRYFNVFGKNQSPNGAYAAVIPKFIIKLINLESPIINGDGKNSRDFTHIENIIYLNMLSLTTDNQSALNQIYNGACSERTSLNDLFKILKTEIKKHINGVEKIEVIYGPERIGDVLHSEASIDKSNKLLGYSPTIKIKSGLSKTIEWYIHKYNDITKN